MVQSQGTPASHEAHTAKWRQILKDLVPAQHKHVNTAREQGDPCMCNEHTQLQKAMHASLFLASSNPPVRNPPAAGSALPSGSPAVAAKAAEWYN